MWQPEHLERKDEIHSLPVGAEVVPATDDGERRKRATGQIAKLCSSFYSSSLRRPFVSDGLKTYGPRYSDRQEVPCTATRDQRHHRPTCQTGLVG